jgi:hypothetical protein
VPHERVRHPALAHRNLSRTGRIGKRSEEGKLGEGNAHEKGAAREYEPERHCEFQSVVAPLALVHFSLSPIIHAVLYLA